MLTAKSFPSKVPTTSPISRCCGVGVGIHMPGPVSEGTLVFKQLFERLVQWVISMAFGFELSFTDSHHICVRIIRYVLRDRGCSRCTCRTSLGQFRVMRQQATSGLVVRHTTGGCATPPPFARKGEYHGRDKSPCAKPLCAIACRGTNTGRCMHACLGYGPPMFACFLFLFSSCHRRR